MAVNVERKKQGLEPAQKLTVQLLKTHLRGKLIRGQEWKAGNKKKDDLVSDYRCSLGREALRPTVVVSAMDAGCWGYAGVCLGALCCSWRQPLPAPKHCQRPISPFIPMPNCSAQSCRAVYCHLLP